MTNGTAIKFYYNGLRCADGKLQRAHYTFTRAFVAGGRQIPDHLTIYCRDYEGFSADVHAVFTVENHTDRQTDYFDKDTINVPPSHPLFAKVVEALVADMTKSIARCIKNGKTRDAEGYQHAIDDLRAFQAEQVAAQGAK